jgi:hypothetical protein
MSIRIAQLSTNNRLMAIGSLHLKSRTVHVLQKAGIRTIGQLVDWSIERRPHIFPGAGEETWHDIVTALGSLHTCVQDAATFAWTDYARIRGYTILPDLEQGSWRPRAFIRELPTVADSAVQIRFGANGSFILRNSLLRPPTRRMSLAHIGRNLGLTRERVRQIASGIVRMFRGIVRTDDYCDCEFRICPEFLRPLHSLSGALEAETKSVLSYFDWESMLAETWKIRPLELADIEQLLLEVLGFQQLDYRQRMLRPRILTKKRNSKQLRGMIRHIERLLTDQYPYGLRPEELLSAVRRELGDAAPPLSEIPALVRSIATLEDKKVDGRYRARAGSLKKATDRYERLLRETGKPLHFREIARRTHRITRSGRLIQPSAISSALTGDPRFVAVAQSGFWALAEWRNIETRTITDIAADLLEKAGRPVSSNRLYTLITARRSAAKDSIRALLRRDNRFQKSGAKMWTLRKIDSHNNGF